MRSNLITRRAPDAPVEPLDIGDPSGTSRAARSGNGHAAGHIDGRIAQSGLYVPGISRGARLMRAGKELPTRPTAPREAGVFYNENARMAGRLGSEAAWEMGAPGLTGSKVNAQDREPIAYGDRNTLNYALSAALHGGDTGLSQEDEATLTKAVVAGDQDAINAADFRLRQRYPAYARRIERELRALNEEE